MKLKSRIINTFQESLIRNTKEYSFYIKRLEELGIASIEWENLPDTVDERYIEYNLFFSGSVVYFNDEVVGNLCLNCIPMGSLNVYGNPVKRKAYSRYNNYQKRLDESDSVIVWNNMLRTPTYIDIQKYALQLALLDNVININTNAQKTPILLSGPEKQKLTLQNLYKEYDGNSPVIHGYDSLNFDALKVLKTDAPYLADKIYDLKTQVWNEALTMLGITNVSVQKKERLITDEVIRGQGGTYASRFSRLATRLKAAEKINQMFGTDIKVHFRFEEEKTIPSVPEFGGDDLE